MDLNALETFMDVVRAGSFSAAARRARMPRSSVSLRIRNLEKALGVRLFKRSTRAFALTAEGEELYRRSVGALTSLTDTLADLREVGQFYTGEIRMTLPADFPPKLVAAAISEFSAAHPKVRFNVVPTNAVLDLVSENIDIALRIGVANPQDAIVRSAIDMELGFYASAEYLRDHGEPESISTATHLIGPQRPELRRLIERLLTGGVLPQFHITVDSFVFILELVLRGQGIGLLPGSLCRAAVASGVLVQVFPNILSSSIRLHLTYPSRADISSKVKAFAEILTRHLETAASS
jgi:DNA-binding transcriptional LysR family regulator